MSTVFYYREGCLLCDELAALLFRNWPDTAERMRWVDIDEDEELVARYGTRVPVLTVAGQEVCAGRPDTAALRRCFG